MPVGGDGVAEDPLLGTADAVAAPARVLEHLAPALVDEQVAADLLRVVRGEPLGAQLASGLLVDDGATINSSPRAGRQPSRASEAPAAISAATCDFMSIAPRPQRKPSITSPDHGS